MPLENFSISRVCLHEVYRRSDEGAIEPPLQGTANLNLDGRAQAAFESRIINAFRSDAKCMDMQILEPFAGSVADRGYSLLDSTSAQFPSRSFEFAELLAQAQGSRSIPGGVLAVFQGTVSYPAVRFFGIMKAELQEAFLREENLQATFVENLFLSPKAKLYKIGIFIETDQEAVEFADRLSPSVFDSNLSARNRDGAAAYFHSAFLGLGIPDNSAFQVRKFFENTKQFIASSGLDQEDKIDMFNSLTSYLKVDQSPNIQVSDFAQRFMAGDLEQRYNEFMRMNDLPTGAIPKDLSEVLGQLRIRRMRFPRRIQLSGPSEAISDLVTIDDVEGDEGQPWTQVTIRGRMQGQE